MNKPCLPFRLVLAGLLAAILTGCAAPPAPVIYHSLLGADTGLAAAARADGPALVVGPVSVPDLLHNTLAENHRWAGGVDREIGRALAERLAADLATERVTLFPQAPKAKSAWRVQVEVLALDGEPGHSAHLKVRWTLLNPAGTGPRTRRNDYRQPLTEPGHAAWVAGQRANLARLGADIAAMIRTRGVD